MQSEHFAIHAADMCVQILKCFVWKIEYQVRLQLGVPCIHFACRWFELKKKGLMTSYLNAIYWNLIVLHLYLYVRCFQRVFYIVFSEIWGSLYGWVEDETIGEITTVSAGQLRDWWGQRCSASTLVFRICEHLRVFCVSYLCVVRHTRSAHMPMFLLSDGHDW